MKLIVLQVAVFIFAAMYLLIAAGEKEKIGRVIDTAVGVGLFILLYVTILIGGGA